MMVNPKVNCPGQECHERESCRRYKENIPSGFHAVREDVRIPVFEWASFDIEAALVGSCEVKIPWRRRRVS